jgi:hypothetical protein
MSRAFFNIIAVLSVMVLALIIDYMLRINSGYKETLSAVVAISGVEHISLQKAFYQDSYNVAYPEMVGIKKMDFIYAK